MAAYGTLGSSSFSSSYGLRTVAAGSRQHLISSYQLYLVFPDNENLFPGRYGLAATVVVHPYIMQLGIAREIHRRPAPATPHMRDGLLQREPHIGLHLHGLLNHLVLVPRHVPLELARNLLPPVVQLRLDPLHDGPRKTHPARDRCAVVLVQDLQRRKASTRTAHHQGHVRRPSGGFPVDLCDACACAGLAPMLAYRLAHVLGRVARVGYRGAAVRAISGNLYVTPGPVGRIRVGRAVVPVVGGCGRCRHSGIDLGS